MKLVIKFFLGIYNALYRLSGGRIGGRMAGGDVLLLSTVGRKTGKKRVTPLMYVRDGDSYVVAASNGGQPSHPGWYFNVKANPAAHIQVLNKTIAVAATEATTEQRDKLFERFVQVNAQYGNYQEKLDRTIPVIILTPTK